MMSKAHVALVTFLRFPRKVYQVSRLVFASGTVGTTQRANTNSAGTQRAEFCVWKHNIELLVDSQGVVLFKALDVEFGLRKRFATVLEEEFVGFKYLRDVFIKLTEAKVGIFVGL